MSKRTVQDVKNELTDKINSLVRQREKLVIEANKLEDDIKNILEQQLALDSSISIVYKYPPFLVR